METILVRLNLVRKEEEPPGQHLRDIKLKPGQKIAIVF